MDESCPQSEAAGGIKIADMCGAHHDVFRLEAQQIGCRQVRFAIRFVVPGKLGGENQVQRDAALLAMSDSNPTLPFESGAMMNFFLSRRRPGTESGHVLSRCQTRFQ